MKKFIRKVVRKVYYLLPIPQSKREELYHKRNQKNEYHGISMDDMYNTITKYDVISLDIFDTLITRMIYEPDDIFRLMGEKLKQTSFIEDRKKAEQEARLHLKKDVNLTEIYEAYQNLYHVTMEEARSIQKLEEELETKIMVPRKEMLQLIEKLAGQNKTLIIVSDMYLESKVILKILKHCGYDKDIFDNIYISNEINKRKDTKEIWPYIQKIYKGKKIIHIGDNDLSDVQYPREFNIDTIKIMSSKELLSKSAIYDALVPYINERKISDSIFMGMLFHKRIFNSPFSNLKINTIEEFGYSFHGPILTEFLKFIFENTAESDALLFLAREGYYLQMLYKDYAGIYNSNSKDNVYFLASRKATYTATIYEEEDIYKMIDKEFTGTFKKFMHQIFDIECEDETEIKLPKDLDLVKTKIKLYSKEILKNSREERKAYLSYCKDTIPEYDKKNLAIIDLGYSGTIQYNLTRLLEKEFTGVYLTNSSTVKKFSKQSKLLFCFDIEKNQNYKNIFYYSLLLEFLLSAPYGQLQRFVFEGNVSKPVYNNESLDKDKKEAMKKIYQEVKTYMKDMYQLSKVYDIQVNQDLLVAIYTALIDSGIISRQVKNQFDFMDSFDASEMRNVFKIISKY